jgi:tripartite-type tricarboxylate transporter receptor subunit TctC
MRLTVIGTVLAATLGSAAAQDYPARAITIIVPAAAGGPTDAISRITAQGMSKQLGQQITIENLGGAGGTLGTTRAARAEPDGYTLLIYHVGLATAATLYRKLAYDTRTAFAPVGLISDAPMTFIARTDLEPNSLTELIAYLKARAGTPKPVTFGNAGIGSASHLCGMLFHAETKAPFTAVPYRGTGPVMNDLIGKQIDMSCDQATNTTNPILAKQVKAYAVTTKARLSSLPDLPDRRRSRLERVRAQHLARAVRPKGHAAGGGAETVGCAQGRAAGPRPGEALQRHQHRSGVAGSRDARGGATHPACGNRPLGADHPGLGGVCRLAAWRRRHGHGNDASDNHNHRHGGQCHEPYCAPPISCRCGRHRPDAGGREVRGGAGCLAQPAGEIHRAAGARRRH